MSFWEKPNRGPDSLILLHLFKDKPAFCKTPSLVTFKILCPRKPFAKVTKSNTATDFKQQSKQKGEGGSYAMAIGMKNSKTVSQASNQKSDNLLNICNGNCCFCNRGKHLFDECETLKVQPHDVKVQLLKKNGICFGCQTRGHMSKTCKKKKFKKRDDMPVLSRKAPQHTTL